MIQLRTFIENTLKAILPNTHFQKYKSTEASTFPYIVYKMPNSTEFEHSEEFILEVNVWDHGENTTNIETITNDVKNALSIDYHEAGMRVRIFPIGRLVLDDPDDDLILRREIRFICKTFMVKGMI